MANFTWIGVLGGDWNNASNWLGVGGTPGIGDNANFLDLATNYTVNVPAGLTVGDGTDGPFIAIDADPSGALTGTPTISISGTLTADFHYSTSASGPATVLSIEAGGALIVPTLLYSTNFSETVTISAAAGTAGGRLELGNITVGGFLSGTNPLVTLDFANAGPMALNTGVIQIDGLVPQGTVATQTIADVANGDAFVFTGLDLTGDTVSYDSGDTTLTVNNGGSTLFTMDRVSLGTGFTGGFEIVNANTIEAITCYARGTMIATPDGEAAVETLRAGDFVLTAEGALRTVRWIGRQTVSKLFADPLRSYPVRVKAGALGDMAPSRDLLISPDHALLFDGVLLQAGALVNGTSIVRERTVPELVRVLPRRGRRPLAHPRRRRSGGNFRR